MTVAVHVKLTAQPGKGSDLVAAFDELFNGPIAEEPGTLAYVISQGRDNPDEVFFFELYKDDDAFKAHSSGAALRAVFPKLAGLLAGRPESTVTETRNAHGLPG